MNAYVVAGVAWVVGGLAYAAVLSWIGWRKCGGAR